MGPWEIIDRKREQLAPDPPPPFGTIHDQGGESSLVVVDDGPRTNQIPPPPPPPGYYPLFRPHTSHHPPPLTTGRRANENEEWFSFGACLITSQRTPPAGRGASQQQLPLYKVSGMDMYCTSIVQYCTPQPSTSCSSLDHAPPHVRLSVSPYSAVHVQNLTSIQTDFCGVASRKFSISNQVRGLCFVLCQGEYRDDAAIVSECKYLNCTAFAAPHVYAS